VNTGDLPDLSRAALFERLAAGSPMTVLCVSARLVQQLHGDYARWQAGRGVRVWATPPIRTLDLHLRDHAAPFAGPDALADSLSSAESELLWRLIVAESGDELSLLREGEAARVAAEAWRLCVEYDVDLPLPPAAPEVEAFNRWSRQYRERCRKLGRADPTEQHRETIESLARVSTATVTVLAGFEPGLPWLPRLLAALSARGGEILRLAEGTQAGRVAARSAPSPEQELIAAAQWVRAQALADPDARIGVIVPALAARRADLMRIFDQVLCPSLDSLQSTSAPRPYNLSLGQPLTDYGLIRCALQLLQLGIGGLDLAAAGSLLCSPYWGDADARSDRANLDRLLREQGHLHLDAAILQAMRGDLFREHQMPLSAQRRAEPAQWAERFVSWLDAAGWPGARALDSVEFQTLDAWRELLAAFGALGEVLGPVPASAALAQLSRLAVERVFQPQTPPVNIQVLGALEAVGLDFDALWVLGLDDESWPSAGRPNPFIPFELQRRRGMPHASTAQELDWAERTTQRWRCAAAEVVFSWPASDGDRPLSPSPLIQMEAARAEALALQAWPLHWHTARRAARLDTIGDAYAPSPDLSQALPGGSRLLADQATCPFRAFAIHRLGARALEVPGYGPTAIDRGVLAHRVLESLWQRWRTHSALIALDDAALAQAIAAVVDDEIERIATRAPQRFAPVLRRLEAERLCALLREWLEIERTRPAFTVECLEGRSLDGEGPGEALHRFGDLQLRLRPDRIDRLDDGRRLVIDYKTGIGRKPPWRDARPEEPQLLLYALTEADIEGMAYARLRAGSIGFDGIGASDDLAPKIKAYSDDRDTRDASSWDALMGRWRGELQTITTEVARGLASVTPKHPRQSCRDCDLHALCRIREAAPDAADDDSEVAQ
jgi:ATP-dependent helicase/nuclease subunit B